MIKPLVGTFNTFNRTWVDKYQNLLILLFSITYVILSLTLFKTSFHVNDDVAILNFIKEGFSVFFMSELLGYFLSFLYIKTSPLVPWYGLYFTLFNIIILYLSLKSLYYLIENKNYFFMSCGIFLLFFTPYIISITYTISALMIGTVALIYFSINLGKVISIKTTLLLGILFAHSYLFRTDAPIALVLFSLPFLVYLIVKFQYKIKYILLFFLPLILILVVNTAISNYIKSAELKSYQEFNTIRGKFHGFPVSDINTNNKVILEKNNWSENDYLMLKNWMFWDESKYNINTLSNIFTYSMNITEQNINLTNICYALNQLLKHYKYYIIVLIILILYSFNKLDQKHFVLILLYMTYFFLGALTFELFYRFPERLAVPLFILSIFILLYLLKNQKQDYPFNIKKRTILFIAIIIISPLFNNTKHKVVASERSWENTYLMFNYLQTNYSEYIFVNQAGTPLSNPILSPFEEFTYNLQIIDGGWPIFSPYFYFQLEKFGLTKGEDIYLFLLNHDNVLFAGNNTGAMLIKKFIEEKYGKKCNSIQIDDLKSFKIYRIKIENTIQSRGKSNDTIQ